MATRSEPRGRGLAWAYGIGAAGYGIGILLSALLDLPTGAMIVWTLAALGAGMLTWVRLRPTR